MQETDPREPQVRDSRDTELNKKEKILLGDETFHVRPEFHS